MKPHPDYQSVVDFYAGKSVFITGVTGFLGKVLLEKLLYVCKDIDQVFVLIRDKKDASVQQRIQQLIDLPVYSRIKAEQQQVLKKIVPIIGDINQCNLGISVDDEKKLLDKVSIVFHVAATVKFNEKLDVAFRTNVEGTKYVMSLCKRMKNIKVFVYFSTAYSNTSEQVLEEKLYPPPADLEEVNKFLEQPDHDQTEIEQLFKGHPNTYTFTKALAENAVAEHHGDIPTIIIRPSIVCGASKEPIPGWVDNMFGATGIAITSIKGLNRVVLGNGTNRLDIIPVDYVSNLTIAVAARCKSSEIVTVYNTCTSSCNPISAEKFFTNLRDISFNETFYGLYPTLMFTSNKWMVFAMTFLLQTTPAYVADLFLRFIGREPQYIRLQSKIVLGRNLLRFFTSRSWEMKADRVIKLHSSLSETDKLLFPFDPSDINWNEYALSLLQGIRNFLNGSFKV